MVGRIIIIDGISNSGKTTFCNYLVEAGFRVVEEAPDFIDNNKELGVLSNSVPKTLDEEKNNQNILFNAELMRLKIAKEYAMGSKNVIMDRSFLSTVAMAYALEKDLPFKGAYDYSKVLEKKYLEEIKSVSQSVTISFIFFDVNRDVLMERNQKRKKELSLEWIDEEFLNKQRHSFSASAKCLNTLLIDTSYKSVDDIAKIVCGDNYKRKI